MKQYRGSARGLGNLLAGETTSFDLWLRGPRTFGGLLVRLFVHLSRFFGLDSPGLTFREPKIPHIAAACITEINVWDLYERSNHRWDRRSSCLRGGRKQLDNKAWHLHVPER